MAKQSQQSERQSGRRAGNGRNGDNGDDGDRSDNGDGLMDDLPTDELKDQTRDLMAALGERAMAVAKDKIGDLSERLVGLVGKGLGPGSDGEGGDGVAEGPMKHVLKAGAAAVGPRGGSPVKHLLKAGASEAKEMVMDKIGGGGDGGGGKGKGKKAVTKNTIIEQIDVGVPVRVAYNQWTQFQDFPEFTRRIENVDQKSDEKVTGKTAIYFSHRTWQSTIVEQVPDEHIVWHSQGEKGYIDGTVSFHEVAPSLTKILLVLEYHPQGLFERTGNAFRSQRRRARLELHQFAPRAARAAPVRPPHHAPGHPRAGGAGGLPRPPPSTRSRPPRPPATPSRWCSTVPTSSATTASRPSRRPSTLWRPTTPACASR
jgi:hypothetical protein